VPDKTRGDSGRDGKNSRSNPRQLHHGIVANPLARTLNLLDWIRSES
jgi:hypothetical protein